MTTATIVTDSPAYVWKFWADQNDANEFYEQYADLIDAAAVRLLDRHMTAEWAKRGATMVAVPWQEFTTDNVNLFTPVWDAAENAFDVDDILTEAQLTDEYDAFVRAQPDYDL